MTSLPPLPTSYFVRDVRIFPNVVLAPMEGVTDLTFRRLIRQIGGAGLTCTEFIASAWLSQSGTMPSAKTSIAKLVPSWRNRRITDAQRKWHLNGLSTWEEFTKYKRLFGYLPMILVLSCCSCGQLVAHHGVRGHGS